MRDNVLSFECEYDMLYCILQDCRCSAYVNSQARALEGPRGEDDQTALPKSQISIIQVLYMNQMFGH